MKESWQDKWQVSWLTVVLTVLLTTLSNFLFHVMDQKEKAKWLAYEHKEIRYQNLIRAARVFQTSSYLQDSVELNKKFLEEVDLCLMYCSDDVLRNTWGILDRMRPENRKIYAGDDGTGSLKSLLFAIREDMFREVGQKTNLKEKDIYLTSLILKSTKR